MKNLFDYATKELTQDTFLRWLFENYDDSELEKTVYELLQKFCNFAEDEKIEDLCSSAQEHKIDLSFRIKTNKRNVALFIEDKTFTSEHSQLVEYDKHIDQFKGEYKIFKIFYKTNLIDDADINGIKKAGETSSIKWKTFGINEIVSVFEKYAKSKNLILAQYAQHVIKINNLAHNTQKPLASESKNDLLAWQSYFNNVVIPRLTGNGKKFTCGVWRAGQFPYMCLVITKKGYGEKRVPYLEIRSRDCCDNHFQARVLCYDVLEEDLKEQQQKLIDKIKKINEFISKGLVQSHKGNPIYPKQIGYSQTIDNIVTDEQFVEQVEKFISAYLNAMTDWK